MNQITNRAALEIELCDRTHTVESAETTVHPIKLEIDRETPCAYVLENEKIHYVFKVKNLCDITLHDITFKSFLGANCEFMCDSFTIDGQSRKACLRGNTVMSGIEELHSCQTLTVAFDVKAKNFQTRCGGDTGNTEPQSQTCPCGNGNFVHASSI